MSRDLSKVEGSLYSSEILWNTNNSKHGYRDYVAFNLQQCVEVCVKYLYKVTNLEIPRVHDIRILLSGNAILQTFKYYKELLSMSDTLNKWYVESRYVTDFVISKQDVENAFLYCKNLLEFCYNYDCVVLENTDNKNLVQAILDRNNTKLQFEDIADLIPSIYLNEKDISIKILNDIVMLAVKAHKS